MKHKNIIIVITCCILSLIVWESKAEKVSSKLNFDDSDSESEEDDDEDASLESKQIAPKIQGLRVIVDTTKINKKTVDSKSNEDEMSAKNSKKTVGIQTDITFEISDDVISNNSFVKKKKKDGDKNIDDDDDDVIDNASVPVFKGTKGITKPPSNGILNNRPFYPSDGAIFHRTDDESNRYGGSLDNNWPNYIPSSSSSGIWTTERSYFLRRKDYSGFKGSLSPSFTANRQPWKPCLCASDPQFRTDTRTYHQPNNNGFVPSRVIPRIDDKLDGPFKNERK